MGRKRHVDKTQTEENQTPDLRSSGQTARTDDDLLLPQSPAVNIPAKPKPKTKKVSAPSLRYQKSAKLVEKKRIYGLEEAVELCKKVSTSRFDGSLEAHFNLDLNTQDEQKIRASLTLPHSTGKAVRVLAFVTVEQEKSAREAGADLLGNEATIGQIAEGLPLNFDKVVATPDFMSKLAKIAKILGPKGLMPSPKTGTVSSEPEKAIAELKKGRLEIKTEANAPVVHLGLGKLSSPTNDLKENFLTALKAIQENKPPKAPAQFIKSIYLAPTMGPSVRLDLKEL